MNDEASAMEIDLGRVDARRAPVEKARQSLVNVPYKGVSIDHVHQGLVTKSPDDLFDGAATPVTVTAKLLKVSFPSRS